MILTIIISCVCLVLTACGIILKMAIQKQDEERKELSRWKRIRRAQRRRDGHI